MIHHLLFSDTLILDAMFPIYLIWDSVFGFNFYQPYIKPLPISLRTDEFPWGMLIFYTYGYLMSFAFTVYLPLVLVGDTLKGKLNKKIFFSYFSILAIFLLVNYPSPSIAQIKKSNSFKAKKDKSTSYQPSKNQLIPSFRLVQHDPWR